MSNASWVESVSCMSHAHAYSAAPLMCCSHSHKCMEAMQHDAQLEEGHSIAKA
jgi:hypothetical protein